MRALQRPILSDFLDLQRQSFYYLLEFGLIEEFERRNPIQSANDEWKVEFHAQHYRLSVPYLTPEQAIIRGKSYVAKLYMPVQWTHTTSQRVRVRWVLVGHLPLMTKRGHFIIRGAPRVVVNQILRSPGVYYREKVEEFYESGWEEKPVEVRKRHYADIICLRGTWLRLEVMPDKDIWARTKRGPSMPAWWLLLGMGLPERLLLKILPSPSKWICNKVHHPIQAWTQIGLCLQPPATVSSSSGLQHHTVDAQADLGRQWVYTHFMNPRSYDLGKYGRRAMNRQLGLNLPLTETTLTAQDVLRVAQGLHQVDQGLRPLDDIDHLNKRRVRTSGELVQIQISVGLLRLETQMRQILNQHSNMPPWYGAIRTKAFNGALREFFGTSPLSQFLDQINPLAELTHKRRLTAMGPGGITRDNATMLVRGIHPTHYGRICPVETPEGKNTGLVNSLTIYARVNPFGLVETPFYRVYQGQVQTTAGFFFLSAEQEQAMNLVAGDVHISSTGFLKQTGVPVKSGRDFKSVDRKSVRYMAVSPHQMISIATALIPFLEHDDANRALMGSNMQRQSVPLLRPERAWVRTGLEARVVSDSGHALQTNVSGLVTYVSSDRIVICTKNPNIVSHLHAHTWLRHTP